MRAIGNGTKLRGGTVLLSIAVGVVVALLALRQSAIGTATNIAIHDWNAYAVVGHREGPVGSLVTIVMFTDYQCPWCRSAAQLLERVRTQYPDSVAIVVRHFPLGMHANARLIATAVECAGEQDRFGEFQRLVYAGQDDLDTTSWYRLARQVSIPDSAQFIECLRQGRYSEHIERDIAAGTALGITGTPTLLVNETMIVGSPPWSVLDSLIREKLRQR